MGKYKFSQNAYPIMVLRALESGHAKYEEIQNYIEKRYRTNISTKTIYRHVKLIKSLGFKIADKSPYVTWPDGKKLIVTNDEKFGHAAYPLMILVVLQSRCEPYESYEEIIEQIQTVFKTEVERKAVGRNIDVIEDKHKGYRLGYRIRVPQYLSLYELYDLE